MARSIYRGFHLQALPANSAVWQVKIKNHVLQGSLTAVKKSIDWFCDTASIVDPKEFASLDRKTQSKSAALAENFNGYQLKNDTGEPNAWYCMFQGKLLKGSKGAIQRHIEAYLIAKKKAEQQMKK